jgi:hypothetical protein
MPADDAADGPALQIRPAIVAQILDIVEGVLEQAGDRAVITRRRQDEAVSRAQGLDQPARRWRTFRVVGEIMSQRQRRPGDDLDSRSGL